MRDCHHRQVPRGAISACEQCCQEEAVKVGLRIKLQEQQRLLAAAEERAERAEEALTAVQLSHARLEEALELERKDKAALHTLYDHAVKVLKEAKARAALKAPVGPDPKG